LRGKPKAIEIAKRLEEIHQNLICEGCEVLRGANLFAVKHFGKKKSGLFDENLSKILTTHVDLGCSDCPVEEVMKLLSKDRLAAVAAML
jgi:hypothetical protein